jgi:hypothetical protein
VFVFVCGIFLVRLSLLARTGVVGYTKPLMYVPEHTLFASSTLVIAEPAGLVAVLYAHSSNNYAAKDAGLLIVSLEGGVVELRCCFSPGCVGGNTGSQCSLPQGLIPIR